MELLRGAPTTTRRFANADGESAARGRFVPTAASRPPLRGLRAPLDKEDERDEEDSDDVVYDDRLLDELDEVDDELREYVDDELEEDPLRREEEDDDEDLLSAFLFVFDTVVAFAFPLEAPPAVGASFFSSSTTAAAAATIGAGGTGSDDMVERPKYFFVR
jgi:hypothetical protein